MAGAIPLTFSPAGVRRVRAVPSAARAATDGAKATELVGQSPRQIFVEASLHDAEAGCLVFPKVVAHEGKPQMLALDAGARRHVLEVTCAGPWAQFTLHTDGQLVHRAAAPIR